MIECESIIIHMDEDQDMANPKKIHRGAAYH